MKLLINTNVILDMVLKRSGCDISMELFCPDSSSGPSSPPHGNDYVAYGNQNAASRVKFKTFDKCQVMEARLGYL